MIISKPKKTHLPRVQELLRLSFAVNMSSFRGALFVHKFVFRACFLLHFNNVRKLA